MATSFIKDTYNSQEVESKWQNYWKTNRLYEASQQDAQRPSFYSLEMFPYPSGNLHMGHVRNYTLGDVISRFQRMNGKRVLHPIGWDAFGLPAENAAIKHKVHPEAWTRSNISTMRTQLQALGLDYDWTREFATCDEDYYRWNQWFFIQFFKKGLVYKKKASVNWCPSCQTVLANEQVSADGACWRCDSKVEAKELEQWFIRITDYAEALLQDHDLLKGKWPDQVLSMQSHWIGRSEGAEVQFSVEGETSPITVFTTRPDTLFGATFLALSPDHPLAIAKSKGTSNEATRQKFLELQRERKRDHQEVKDKLGYALGISAKNPVNGKQIPIWVADYVLSDYGTGAIMAVPAHDQRDFDFASKYQLPIIQVISDKSITGTLTAAYEGDGILINSESFNGMSTDESKKAITLHVEKLGFGKKKITYKLRDWLVSRQRYWGTPIPIIQCSKCGLVPVPESDLPVRLPTDVQFTGSGESPLAQSASFQNVSCPTCKGPAKRESDTMDTFVDSSWYYARYTDSKNKEKPFSPKDANAWLPVNQYIGGIEHACMHLIYSRFWHKAMKDLGLVTSAEPFERLLAQGMVTLGGSAMSKSRGNVVDPNGIIEKYGADTARLFILFAAPPEKQLEWSDAGVEGSWRFLNRVWRMVMQTVEAQSANHTESPELSDVQKSLKRKEHWAIQKVTHDLSKNIQINTAIAAVMELVNELYAYPSLGDKTSRGVVQTVIQLLSPMAPHLMEECWSLLGQKGCASVSAWPQTDPQWLVVEEIQVVIQVNGKLRGQIACAPKLPKEQLEALATSHPKIKPHIEGKQIVKIIVIPDKLVNLVVRE